MDLQALDANYYRSMGLLLACSEAGSSDETDHVHLRSCGVPFAEFNVAHLKLPVRDLDAAVSEARSFFSRLGLPFRFVLREAGSAKVVKELASHGFHVARSVPGMALDPIRMAAREADGLQIRRVRNDNEIHDFQQTSFAGFGYAAGGAARFLPKRLFERPEVAGFVGNCDGAPASTALLVVTGRVAGIYFVATLEAFRRRGLGERLTWATVEEGIARGCSVASLQASEMGKPVYAGMGFEMSGDYLQLEATS